MFALVPRSLINGTSPRAVSTLTQQKTLLFEALNIITSTTATGHVDRRDYHEVFGDTLVPGQIKGIDHLRDPRLNKGLAFTLEERQALGIHGLQPARFKSQEEQLELCRLSLGRYLEPLNKYIYLTELQDRNEKLFYRLLSENIEDLMPIVYTPTVGLACQRFGLIYRRPRGLFITSNDKGHVRNILQNWPEPNIKVIVVTDGERILGLGDLGANGMGIPVGKLALYTALAGIPPNQCLPILLDVGTNNQKLLEDPLYVGLRRTRVTGDEYDEFLDEFMDAAVHRFGQNILIQFEDFGNANAFRLLDKYRNTYCTFNDDIQGTAAVAVSGLMATKRITGKKLSQHKILFLGAGGAALGIANLAVKAMESEGVSETEARAKIWMFDADGLLAKNRPEGKINQQMAVFAKDHKPMKDFSETVKELKPSILIGASTVGGAFTPEILKNMGAYNERPVIFALSNPTSKAECTAEAAYTNTEGRCVFASGSPFDPVEYNGKTYYPGQGNNAYVFPGIGLGVVLSGLHHISEDIFLIAARCVAEMTSQEDLDRGRIYPSIRQIRDCSVKIAVEIMNYGYKTGITNDPEPNPKCPASPFISIATVYPEPSDKLKYVKNRLYNYNYSSAMPLTYDWPQLPKIKTRPIEPTKLSA